MSIGIRMHDLAKGTLAQRVGFAKEQGFGCVHLALSKVIDPKLMEPACATPGLAAQLRDQLSGMDVAVLGCYLNLTHPDEEVYHQTLKKYIAHLRLGKWLNCGVVGSETGNPNSEYRYDPLLSHSPEALELFIDRLRPVVQAAEKLGVIFAIEPVFTHIVCDPTRARFVLDEIASPNLQIIFDPVNLLHPSNLHRRDALLEEAMELLCDDIAVIHLKDYRLQGDTLTACAVGTGEMDYRAVLDFAVHRKPGIQMTLENTTPENAVAARKTVERIMEECR